MDKFKYCKEICGETPSECTLLKLMRYVLMLIYIIKAMKKPLKMLQKEE